MGNKDSGTPKADALVLDGHQIKDGKITKSTFFDFLNMDLSDYSDIVLTPEEALKFRNHVVRMTHGVAAAIPLLCGGENCPNKICPFHESKKYPLTKPCILETRMVQVLTASYMDELKVDPESITEMIQINKLVELDITDYRANLGLSGGKDVEAATLLKTSIIQIGEHETEQVNVHPLMEIKEKTHNARMRALEALAATRREKYKRAAALKHSDDSDASEMLSELASMFGDKGISQTISSLDKIKEDAEKVASDSILDTDWESVK